MFFALIPLQWSFVASSSKPSKKQVSQVPSILEVPVLLQSRRNISETQTSRHPRRFAVLVLVVLAPSPPTSTRFTMRHAAAAAPSRSSCTTRCAKLRASNAWGKKPTKIHVGMTKWFGSMLTMLTFNNLYTTYIQPIYNLYTTYIQPINFWSKC